MDVKKTSINTQTPATTNSVRETKPQVEESINNVLEGFITNSWFGGMLKPIAYKKVMAGERIKKYTINGVIRMLTPQVPAMQKLSTVFKAYFVPNTRVWDNAEKYQAQKGDLTKTKIKQVPSFTGTELIERQTTATDGQYILVTDTTYWRDCWASSYIPRMLSGKYINNTQETYPKMNILPLRGFKAIYNDMLRHKVYDTEMTEYKDDTMSTAEFNSIIPKITQGIDTAADAMKFMPRGKKRENYTTNYTISAEGQNNNTTAGSAIVTNLNTHNEWQKLLAESRTQSQNEQRNDWDIIAEMRGTRPVQDGKVQFLAEREIGINYQQVSQTSYNTNPDIREEFQTLGATGAFSYTEFNIDILNYNEFIEDGYIHIIAQTSSDVIYETGIDRHLLNITWDSEYRPDFKELKTDTMYQLETDSAGTTTTGIKGYKRKFSEYFKLPNCINGELTTVPIKLLNHNNNSLASTLITQYHYQFMQVGENTYIEPSINYRDVLNFKRHLDYTDFFLNRNQAILQATDFYQQPTISGNNQIYFMANCECICNMPIDNSIKNDFKKWGEM